MAGNLVHEQQSVRILLKLERDVVTLGLLP
jgi:hypothetical protein